MSDAIETTGDLRAQLARCFVMARDGKLQGDALRGVIGTANQINLSMSVEIKQRDISRRAGEVIGSFGALSITNVRAPQARLPAALPPDPEE